MDLTLDTKGIMSLTQNSPMTEFTASPKPQPSGRTTASDLLAAFSPVSQSKKESQPWVPSPKFPIVMSNEKRRLRRKEPVHYQISDPDDSESAESTTTSFFTPTKRRQSSGSKIIGFEEEYLEIEPPKTPPPRVSSAGHSLRQHRDLHLSLRAQENGDKPAIKRRRVSTKRDRHSATAHGKGIKPPPRTARNEIRETISRETAVKKGNFYVAKKDYFLPLLPENNSISRLIEARHAAGQQGDEDFTIPYEALEQQPQGCVFSALHLSKLTRAQHQSDHETLSAIRSLLPCLPT